MDVVRELGTIVWTYLVREYWPRLMGPALYVNIGHC